MRGRRFSRVDLFFLHITIFIVADVILHAFGVRGWICFVGAFAIAEIITIYARRTRPKDVL